MERKRLLRRLHGRLHLLQEARVAVYWVAILITLLQKITFFCCNSEEIAVNREAWKLTSKREKIYPLGTLTNVMYISHNFEKVGTVLF